MYENGADSSNLIETRIHKNLIFVTRIAPLDAFIFFHLAKTSVITVVFQQDMVSPNLELAMASTFNNKTIHTLEMKPIGRWTR